jgi:FMN phosphatase YigB (HAD superfamily)
MPSIAAHLQREIMTFTLLLDLDDTLLETNLNDFISGYFRALAGHLQAHVSPNILLPALIAGTQKMMENQDPLRTLEEVFDATFYPAIGVPRADIYPELVHFYQEIFPTLQPLTRTRPEARALVDWALERGYRVEIATAPLFPLVATEHRLRWAGLPHEDYPFAFVPSFETFHFTKPQPAFFAELRYRLLDLNAHLLMAGDDEKMDILAGTDAGLPVFHVRSAADLNEIRTQIETRGTEAFVADFSKPSALIHTLHATPALCDTFARSLDPLAWTTRPSADTWSLTEIFCHLRDVEREVNLPRVQAVLGEHDAFLSGQNTDPWADERAYNEQDGRLALREFAATRLQLLNLLRTLTPADWEKPARHAIFGPTTLCELVSFMAEHDRTHLEQGLRQFFTR